MNLTVSLIVYNFVLFSAVLLTYNKLLNINSRNESCGFRWNYKLTFLLVIFIIISANRVIYPESDYSRYTDFYNYILTSDEVPLYLENKEIGYRYINILFATMGIPSKVFFALIVGFTWLFFIKGSYRYQYLLPLMFFFVIANGFFFWTFDGIRQSIAIMIFFYAIRFIIEKNIFNYSIWIFFASLFHLSAIILLPVYFLNRLRFNQKFVFLLYFLSIFFIGSSLFLDHMITLISYIASKLELPSTYIYYLESAESTIQLDKGNNSGLGVILRILTNFYILFMSKKILIKQPELTIYFILFFIFAIGSNIFFSVAIMERILMYFGICFAIVIAATIYFSNKKYEILIALTFLYAFFLMYQVTIYRMVNAMNI